MIQFYPSDRGVQNPVTLEVSCETCGYSEETRRSGEKMAVFRAKLAAREHGQLTDHNKIRIGPSSTETDRSRGGDADE